MAPAMNGKMWEHPATEDNVEQLKARGVEFIGPEEGMLAAATKALAVSGRSMTSLFGPSFCSRGNET